MDATDCLFWSYLHANLVLEITISSFETQLFLFSEIAINSTMLLKNDSYMYSDHLRQFLAPAVGNDPGWLLCYRASSHGWSVSTFHSRCDGKMNTVTIIKKDEYVFGGFTNISWGKVVVYMLSLTFSFACIVNRQPEEKKMLFRQK